MAFVSVEFLVFIGVICLIYFLVPAKAKWGVLLMASYMFYAFSSIKMLVFLLFTTVTTFAAGRSLGRISKETKGYIAANKGSLKREEKKAYKETEEWRLIIPKINISAKIKEGTNGEIINNYIGHFTETPTINGNIGLIAASAGYKENYFSQLKDLVEGDVIIYIIGDNKKEYKVTKNIEIEETDWSHLSNREENILTLITGILEKPESRRCVQAIEI